MKLDSQIRIIDRRQIARVTSGHQAVTVDYYRRPDGELLMLREIETYPVSCKPSEVVGQFRVNPATHVYDAVAFSPHQLPATTLNYWSPSPVRPKQGDWRLLQRFLLNVIAAGDRELCGYLVCFLAHMLQKPEQKPGIVLVFLGGEGVGKGTFSTLLRRIWPATTLQVSDVDEVTGGFNAALERNYAVFMDEALFSGDRKALDRLKSLVTEPYITIEQKYEPRRQIESFHRFFAASNHDHFATIGTDDRRFVFFRVPDTKKGDHAYFNTLHAAIDDADVISAMVFDLLNLDLSDFDIRQRPKTREQLQQKLRSLAGFDSFWAEVLQTGDLSAGCPHAISREWTDGIFVSTESLKSGAGEFLKRLRHHRSLSNRDISAALKKWCPAAIVTRRKVGAAHQRGYDLPTLADARRSFENSIGGKIDWDDG